MKHGLKKSNKTQRKRNKKMNKSRSKTIRRMRGGTPDGFNSSKSIITFSTSGGHDYILAKNPKALLKELDKLNEKSFRDGIGDLRHVRRNIQTDKYERIIGKTEHVMDLSDELFGMFFVYRQNSNSPPSPPYPQYGLFYLLNRIQLLAVLYKIKTMPDTKFPTLDVSLPINKDSILPNGYNTVPHGYLFQCTEDTSDINFDEFIKFVQQMNELNQDDLHLPLNEDAIAALTMPSFLKLTRMQNAKIVTETPSTLQTKMDELDGGRRAKTNM
jgi:hypothetical protein